MVKKDLEDNQEGGWKDVFAKDMRKPLLLGIGLAVFQQVTGINAIIYYSDKIFAQAGWTTAQAQDTATLWAVGVVNVLATLIAIFYVDKLGRKPLLRRGLIGMALALMAVAAGFYLEEHGGSSGLVSVLTMGGLIVFIASFAFSLGPIVWTVINEIFPNRVRGKAVAVSTAFNWGAAFIVSETFLSVLNGLGGPLTFTMFAVISIAGYIWVGRYVIETKGKSLEEISEELGV